MIFDGNGRVILRFIAVGYGHWGSFLIRLHLDVENGTRDICGSSVGRAPIIAWDKFLDNTVYRIVTRGYRCSNYESNITDIVRMHVIGYCDYLDVTKVSRLLFLIVLILQASLTVSQLIVNEKRHRQYLPQT